MIDRNLVKLEYEKLGKIQLVAQALNINEKSVRNILKELGVKTTPRHLRNKKYKVKDRFFQEINSDKQAYLLGFICADGHINNSKGNYVMTIELSKNDENHLIKIKDLLETNYSIRERVRKSPNSENKTTSVSLTICRKSMIQDLISLGLKSNKTWSSDIPNIDERYFFPWLRGFIDGDGCIRIDPQNRVSLNIISTIQTSNSIIDKLKKYGVKARQSIDNKNYSKPLARTLITSKEEVIKLRSLLYSNAEIFLDRKKLIFDRVKYLDQRKYGEDNPFFGKNHSLKTKEKLREANLGEKCGNAKLTTKDVIFIKSNLHLKTKDLASEFGVSKGTIRSIKRGDTWSHVVVKGGD